MYPWNAVWSGEISREREPMNSHHCLSSTSIWCPLPLWHRTLLTMWLSALASIAPCKFSPGSADLRPLVQLSSACVMQSHDGRGREFMSKVDGTDHFRARSIYIMLSCSHDESLPSAAWKPGTSGAQRENVSAASDWTAQYSISAELHEEINRDTTYLNTYTVWRCKRPSDVSRSIPQNQGIISIKLGPRILALSWGCIFVHFVGIGLFHSVPLQTPFSQEQKDRLLFLQGKKRQRLKSKWL